MTREFEQIQQQQGKPVPVPPKSDEALAAAGEASRRCRLYADLAYLWPIISPPEDYAAEARALTHLLRKSLGPQRERPRLVEFGAGGGHTLFHLQSLFECTAVDLSPAMLANCKRLNPDVPTHVGDMREVRLGQRFDIVLIHDAIDYMTNPVDARAAIATAAAHLNPGGVAVIAPTYLSESFVEHEVEQDFGSDEDRQLTYFSYVHDPNPDDSMFELIMVYLIRDAASGKVRVEEDRHRCGLFDADFWADAMTDAGFDIQLRPSTDEIDDQWIEDGEDVTLPYPWFVGVMPGGE